jgi:hypothetical protein
MCSDDGRCIDPACVGKNCEAGFQCVAGNCVDLCANVVCPGGGACLNGTCQMGTGGGSGSGVGGTGSIDLPGGINLSGSNGLGSGASGSVIPGGTRVTKDPGCACEVVGRSPAGEAALLLAGLGSVLAVARRRRRA